MRDGPIRKTLKAIARGCFWINLAGTRLLRRLRGERPYRLGGACERCAACCEAPSIQTERLTWYFPMLRRIFLAWHRHVNGFELTGRIPSERVFVFRCTHFDWETRRCDSYSSRPGMCRDYPRALLWQSRPDFLPGCGYRAVHPRAEEFRAQLEREGLPPDKLAEVRRRLHLDP